MAAQNRQVSTLQQHGNRYEYMAVCKMHETICIVFMDWEKEKERGREIHFVHFTALERQPRTKISFIIKFTQMPYFMLRSTKDRQQYSK